MVPLTAEESQDARGQRQQETRNLVIPFQNEYLAASLIDPEDPEAREEMICTVPYLISILGQDGEALGSPDLRYGLRCKVIAMPAHSLWTETELGMRVGGSEFFQLGVEFKGIGAYKLPRSIIDEFGS
jgi:DUF917 family protein